MGPDEPDDGGSVGEDPDHVGAPADLLVQTFLGVVGSDLAPVLGGKGAEGQDVVGGVEQIGDDIDETGLSQLVGDVGQLGPGGVAVGLLEAFSSFWASSYKEVIVFTLIIPVLLWRSLRGGVVENEE